MTTTTRAPGILSSALWGVQFVVMAISIVMVYFKRIGAPRCDLHCDFVLLDMTSHVFAIFSVIVFIAVGVLQVLLPGEPKWWLPIVGIALTVGGALVANYVSDIAMSYEAAGIVSSTLWQDPAVVTQPPL